MSKRVQVQEILSDRRSAYFRGTKNDVQFKKPFIKHIQSIVDALQAWKQMSSIGFQLKKKNEKGKPKEESFYNKMSVMLTSHCNLSGKKLYCDLKSPDLLRLFEGLYNLAKSVIIT